MFRKVSELLINVFSTESLITHELLRYVIRLSRVKGHILSEVIYVLEAWHDMIIYLGVFDVTNLLSCYIYDMKLTPEVLQPFRLNCCCRRLEKFNCHISFVALTLLIWIIMRLIKISTILRGSVPEQVQAYD